MELVHTSTELNEALTKAKLQNDKPMYKKKRYIATRVGKCKHCNKEVTSNIIYVSFPNRTIACQKCYHQSGASLIWLNKPQSP